MDTFNTPLRIAAFCLCAIIPAGLTAQDPVELAPEDSFSLEAAILDTSIPFAVGAHEARQELRGAFGWPTFQEGLVAGVYFRFDPDGYARFSPTPRLDTDVFEVICRPRTHVCMARKGVMNITLNSKNQIEIELENATGADTFSIIDGISELQLPNTIQQPLDSRMELLLSAGGDLLISRAQKEVDRVSLSGFGAVIAYLRWVSAQQSYAVLPRDWPIPNSSSPASSAALTQTNSWVSSMPQPSLYSEPQRNPEVAEVRGELRALREMFFDQKDSAVSPASMPEATQRTSIADLEHTIKMLGDELARLQSQGGSATMASAGVEAELTHAMQQSQLPLRPLMGAGRAPTPEASKMAVAEPQADDETRQMLAHMEYLVSEIGLAPAVAFDLLRGENQAVTDLNADEGDDDALVQQVLEELRLELPTETGRIVATSNRPTETEYLLLTDYFRSVFEAR